MKVRMIEIARADFEAFVAAYERKGWTIEARGMSSVEVKRGEERRCLIVKSLGH